MEQTTALAKRSPSFLLAGISETDKDVGRSRDGCVRKNLEQVFSMVFANSFGEIGPTVQLQFLLVILSIGQR